MFHTANIIYFLHPCKTKNIIFIKKRRFFYRPNERYRRGSTAPPAKQHVVADCTGSPKRINHPPSARQTPLRNLPDRYAPSHA